MVERKRFQPDLRFYRIRGKRIFNHLLRIPEKYGNDVELISASSLVEINVRIAAKTQKYLQEKEAPITQTLVSVNLT